MSDVINAHDLGIAGGYIIEAAMQRDIDQLKAENAKLREEVVELRKSSQTYDAENAKLRKLCADMHKALFSLNLDHCQACPREDACVFMHKSFDCNECAFEHDMRKLGVEVNG